MIQVGDNFDHKSKKPLDGRVQYATLAAMKAVSDANIYEGCTAFCVETGKEYRFLSSNTVNENTGKWREHEGQTYTAGNNIEISQNNEISATDTTYSAGDGIVIDSENDNEISADIMPSSDMEEVAYPLPGVRKQGIVYSTKEQVVGEWIDGKPLYQKTFNVSIPTNNTAVGVCTGNDLNISDVISMGGTIIGSSNAKVPLPINDGTNIAYLSYNTQNNVVLTYSSYYKGKSAVITIQYTKTTS